MKKLLSGLLATTLAASFAVASVVPVNATPVFVPKADTAQTDVQNVQYQPWRRIETGSIAGSTAASTAGSIGAWRAITAITMAIAAIATTTMATAGTAITGTRPRPSWPVR